MIRLLDFIFALVGLVVLLPIFLLIIAICYFDTGSPFFVQTRMGKNKRPFRLVKFRTMRIETPDLPTHVVDFDSITKPGRILRSSKLDELPQLLNVLLGSMSLVGPRPNLLDQTDLISEREARAVYSVKPGITGLAQVRGVHMGDPVLLASTDAQMIADLSLKVYFSLIISTVSGRGIGDIAKK